MNALWRGQRSRSVSWAPLAFALLVGVALATELALAGHTFGVRAAPSPTDATPNLGARLELGASAIWGISPSARTAPAMAYDAESGRIVLFGGYRLGFNAETWAYDVSRNVWQNMSPTIAPSGRVAETTYDSESDRVILFGGITTWYEFTQETWAYDLNTNTWTNMQPATSPPKLIGAPLAYDVRRDRVVLFGGHDTGGVAYNDTWTYDYNSNTWTKTTPTTSPPPHVAHVMAYDVESDRVVLFGGAVGQAGYVGRDTWAYDAANGTWVEMKPVASPNPRAWIAGVYDSRADRILMFGGDNPGENETWAYNFNANTWSRIDTASKPSDRGMHAMAYDAVSDRTGLFGGMWPVGLIIDPACIKNRETWVFDRENSTWTMVLGPLPPAAAFMIAPGSPIAGDTVTFDGSASSDADGSIVWFVWDFRDGSPLSGASTAVFDHAFSSGGTYAVHLTVTDDDGLTNTTTQQVIVNPPPDTTDPVIAIALPANGATLTSVTATVTGTASDDVGVAKVEVSLDNATWVVLTGTSSWSATMTLAEGANTIIVRVTDTSGNIATSTIQVTVATPETPMWVWPLVAVGIAGVAAAAYLMMRRRRKPAEEVLGPPP